MKKTGNHTLSVSGRKLLFFGTVFSFIFLSCNTTRRVPDGQYLLTHNTVVYAIHATKGNGIGEKISTLTKRQLAKLTISPEIAQQYILAYVKQKPNTRIMGLIPLHLLIYNLVNPEKAEEKKIERDQRIDDKNKKRMAAGKKYKSDEQLKAKKAKRTFRQWLMSVGEPPVILDSMLMNESLKQVIQFLNSKGYYKCKVHDSVSIRHKKAKVFYVVEPGKPYKIDSVQYRCEDSTLYPLIYKDSANCLINKGDNFDLDNFLKERDRITRYFNDNGYYAFTKEFIHYVLDTNAGSYKMSVKIDISKFAIQDSLNPDSNIEMAHPLYHIRNVIVQMQYNPSVLNYNPGDTAIAGTYMFVYPKGQMTFKPKRLLSKLFIKKGDIYKVSNVDYTYTGLSQLKTFRYVNIKFVPAGPHLLDCYIQLMPTVRQSIGVEAVGNNTGGDLGIQGDASYDNKNLFKGGEVFAIKAKGGLEAQKLLGSATGSTKGINNIVQLNTIDIGGEGDFSLPRPWIPFNLGANFDSTHISHRRIGLWPKANPQTIFKATYDYQRRPLYYSRNIFGLAYTFNYDPYEKKDLKKWNIELRVPEINYVNARLLPGFESTLTNTNNFYLLNSFTNHLIPDLGVTFTYNNQSLTKQRNFQFVKVNLEESGAILRLGDNVIYHRPEENYTIFGVPYSHYVKAELDVRDYIVISKDDKLALRAYGGFGQPLSNFNELPFDKSFWGGGANDIRGWQARSLGPGGYSQTTIVDQIGDVKLEGNIEYRVNVIKLLGLALFADAGNIWLLRPNPNIPNGELPNQINVLFNQMAVAGGIGIRLDFTYFIFRFDFGYPLRDPTKPEHENWTKWHQLTIAKTVLNLGIGYPF